MAEESLVTNADLLKALQNDNAPEELIKIVKDVENNKQIPRDFKLNMSLGLISFDKRSSEFLSSIAELPGGQDILSKFRRVGADASMWGWKPKQIAALFGYESPEAMMDPENGWKKTLSDAEIKEKAYSQGIDYDQLMMWLEGHQASMDKQREYKKGKYLPQKFFAPRTWEAHAAGKDASGKDIALDIGENIAFLLPTTRLGHVVTKAIPLAGLRSGLRTGIGAAIVPGASVVADNVAYDEAENFKRANRGLVDVAEGTVTNIAVPKGLSMAGKKAAKWWNGGKGKNSIDLGEDISFDPYISGQEVVLRAKKGVPVTSDPDLSKEIVERQILKETYPTYAKGIKTERAKQKAEIEAEAKLKPEIQEDYADVESQFDLVPNEALSKQFKDWYKNSNRMEVLPTRALGKKAGLYGSMDGHLVYIDDRALEKLPLGKDHNLVNPVAPSKYSANAQRLEDASKHTAKMYPHKTDFDQTYLNALNNPAYADALRPHPNLDLAKVAGLTYIGNKVGDTKVGSASAKAAVGALGGVDLDDFKDKDIEEVMSYLQDEGMIRMWKDGNFKPHGKTDDPLVRAYNIWAKANGKEIIK